MFVADIMIHGLINGPGPEIVTVALRSLYGMGARVKYTQGWSNLTRSAKVRRLGGTRSAMAAWALLAGFSGRPIATRARAGGTWMEQAAVGKMAPPTKHRPAVSKCRSAVARF